MFLEEFQILSKHGKQYIKDLHHAEVPGAFRGRPIIDATITESETELIQSICPSDAFGANPPQIDMGKCVFCNECHFLLPDKIKFTKDYKIATNTLNNLIVAAGNDTPIVLNDKEIRTEIRSYFKHALKLRQVSAGGDNSAEMELIAAGNVNFDMGRYGIEFVASPRHADGIVITGPITKNMAKPLEICYNAIPNPKIVILVGTDAISGGLFANNDEIDRSFLNKVSVDLYVPGNPPHPLTFINGILKLIGKIK